MSKYSVFGLNIGAKVMGLDLGQSEKAVWLKGEFGVALDNHPKKLFLFYPNKVVEWAGRKAVTHTEGDKVNAARKRWREDVITVIASASKQSSADLLNKVLAKQPKTPQDFIRMALESAGKYEGNLVDVFLEWGTKDGKTFLGFPRDSSDGLFICPTTTDGWRRDEDRKGLVYVKDGRQHPFTRGIGYMKSKRAQKPDFVAEPRAERPAPPKYTPPVEDYKEEDLPF